MANLRDLFLKTGVILLTLLTELAAQNEAVCSPPCQNGGNCSLTGQTTSCLCLIGYYGAACENIDDCSRPQQHGCQHNSTCLDGLGNYTCSCLPGWQGDLCESETNECDSSPCQNGGNCVDLLNGFHCNCSSFYIGSTCTDDIDECATNSSICGNGGTCLNTIGGFSCSCTSGYTGASCEQNIDHCVSSPCYNNGTCLSHINGFSCNCLPAFTGDRCQAVFKQCLMTKPCQNNGLCVDNSQGGYQCYCKAGFTGDRCQVTVDLCQSQPCLNAGTCRSTAGNFTCLCPAGYTGAVCDVPYHCDTTPCFNNGTCSETNGFMCQCPDGFTGTQCQTQVDICTSQPCGSNLTCLVLGTNFSCECPIGTTGAQCETDIFDCRQAMCANGGNCSSKTGNYTCLCPSPYTGPTCAISLDPCSPNPCLYEGTCSLTINTSFVCACPDGFMGSRCEADVNECLSSPCQNGGTCQEVDYSDQSFQTTSSGTVDSASRNQSSTLTKFTCQCPPQFTGYLCDQVLEACSSNPCKNGASCVSESWLNYTCVCAVGWAGSQCEDNINECLLEPEVCLHNGTCIDKKPGYSCVCFSPWTGTQCEATVCGASTCQHGGTCQVDLGGATFCLCAAGYSGADCSNYLTSCEPNPCWNNGTCHSGDGPNNQTFTCACSPGFTGPNCSVNVDECSFDPCQNNATCLDLVAGFECQCLPGFTGVACSIDIDDCASQPCYGAATCLDEVNSFTCTCPTGFQGSHCDKERGACAVNPCKFGGTCTDNGTCLCPAGIDGFNCEVINTANFGGKSALTLPSLDVLSQNTTGSRRRREVVVGAQVQMEFTFTTTVLEGILLVATGISNTGQPQHLALELKPSTLLVSASNGLQLLKGLITLPDAAGDAETHQVQITVQPGVLDVELDRTTCANTSSSCQSVNLTFTDEVTWNLNGSLHFGGVAEFSPYLRNLVQDSGGFVGCLGNLQINGKQVSLATATQFTQNSSESAPQAGCTSHSSCQNSSCANGGTCRDVWVNQTCDCRPGFSGSTCSFQNMAHFEPDNMLHFQVDSAVKEISFWLTATNASGLILYTNSTDLIGLSVDSGQLLVHLMDSSSGRFFTSKLGHDLPLQDWVKITLEIFNNSLTAKVLSSKSELLASTNQSGDDVIIVEGSVFLGMLLGDTSTASWANGSLPTNSFKGCLRDMSINLRPLDLSFSTAASGQDPAKARPGCQREETCLVTQCPLGSLCVGSWTGPASCLCPTGLTGQNCSEETSTTFDGNSSYSIIHLDRALFSFGDDGTIELRTRDSSAFLMVLQFLLPTKEPGQVIEFSIYGGLIQVFSSFSNDTKRSKSIVSDGQWHLLRWVRQGTDLNLWLDQEMFFLQAALDLFQPTLDNTMLVYLGAKPLQPGSESEVSAFFKGCLRGVSFNNISLPFANNESTPAGLEVNSLRLTSGCHGEDVCRVSLCGPNSYCVDQWNLFLCPCLDGWEGINCTVSNDDCKNNSCQNGGLCLDGHLSYTCQCKLNYTGQFCETPVVDYCESSPCANNGTCQNGLTAFTCTCQQGYTGYMCQQLDPCLSQPCFNGGTCWPLIDASNHSSVLAEASNHSSVLAEASNHSSVLTEASNHSSVMNSSLAERPASYTCQCLPPYVGPQCQLLDPCLHNLCLNNATCVHNMCLNNATCVLEVTNYTCTCLLGFQGQYCEHQDACQSSPCLNGGTCLDMLDNFTCSCPAGFSGSTCLVDLKGCGNSPCLNKGKCLDNGQNLTCACTPAFTGRYCDSPLPEQQTNSSSSLSDGAIAAIVIVCVLVLLVLVLLIVWQVRKRQKMRGTYKPARVEGQVMNGDMHLNRLYDRRERG